MVKTIYINVDKQGLHPITQAVETVVKETGLSEGLCSLFIRHTSASLLIQENADPSARHDLEIWLNRLVPEHDPNYTHTLEGPDDMPAHIKSALTASCLSIPIQGGMLALGTWQGIYLWEHRLEPHRRTVMVTIYGE